MWPAPRGDRLHLWRVAEVAASLQAAVPQLLDFVIGKTLAEL
mgnify:CR=1 FL=1